MTIVIILLIIIAIGVLLQSGEGKSLLNGVSMIVLIAGGSIALFYVFIAIYALFTSKWLSSAYDKWLGPLLGGLIILAIVGYWGNALIKQIKELIKENKKGQVIAVVILVLIIIISWIILPIIFS